MKPLHQLLNIPIYSWVEHSRAAQQQVHMPVRAYISRQINSAALRSENASMMLTSQIMEVFP